MTPRLNGDDGHPQGGRSRSAAQPPTLSDMPWRVAKGVEGCDGWAVVKKDDGKVVACHKSRAKANAQIKALYANEAMTAAAVGGLARELLEGSDGMLGLTAASRPFESLTAAERFPQGPSARRRFEESKVKRYPKGTPVSGKVGGGRFAPGDRITGRTMVGNHEVEGEVVGENRFGPIIETTTGETLTVKDSTAVHAETSTIGLESRDPTTPAIHIGTEGELTGPTYFDQKSAENAARRMTEAGYPATAEATDMTDSEIGQVHVVKLQDGTYFGADSSDRLHEAAYADEYGPGIDYSRDPNTAQDIKNVAMIAGENYTLGELSDGQRERIAAFLIDKGHTPGEAAAIMLSKHSRWADDSQGYGAGNKFNSAAFKRYYESVKTLPYGGTDWLEEGRQMARETDLEGYAHFYGIDPAKLGVEPLDFDEGQITNYASPPQMPSMSARDVFHTSAQHAVRRGLESGRSTERTRARSVAGVLKEIEAGALPFTDRELADAVERMNRVDAGGPDRSVNEMMLEVVQGLAIKHGDRRRRRGVTAAAPFFDESRHPRHPKGTREGGRFRVGDLVRDVSTHPRELMRVVSVLDGGSRDDSVRVKPVVPGVGHEMTVPERALEHVASDDPWINPGPDTPIVGDDLSDLADESSSPQMPRPANFPDPKVEKVITVESNDEYGNGIEEFRGWSVNANGMGLIDTDKVGWSTQNYGMSSHDAGVIAAHADEISAIVEAGGPAEQAKRDKLTTDLAKGGDIWGIGKDAPPRPDLAMFHSMFGPRPGEQPRARITAQVTPTTIEIGEYDYGSFKASIPRKDAIVSTSSEKHDPPMPTRRDVGLALTVEDWSKNRTQKEVNEVTRRMRRRARGITAAVTIPVAPPKDWFKDPGLSRGTPLTVTSDGRVYGHLALWDACHIGDPSGPGVCVAPPRSGTGYTLFHLGELETAEGEIVPVGKITLGTGHASLQASRGAATAHYDNTGMVVADVRAGEDGHGIWISGALRPSVSEAQVRELRAAGVSGDWRRYRNALELVAALAVNVPGFPIPRVAALVAPELDGDERVTLVAAGLHAPLVPGMTDDEAHARIEALSLLAGVGGEPVMDLYFPR